MKTVWRVKWRINLDGGERFFAEAEEAKAFADTLRQAALTLDLNAPLVLDLDRIELAKGE